MKQPSVFLLTLSGERSRINKVMKRFSNDRQVVTIRDVALRAGVSITAASYALNDTGRISAEKKAAVLLAAEALGYTPSLVAQMLKGAQGNLVAILTDGFAGPWYGELLEGIQPMLKNAGFVVLAITLQKESLTLCRNLAHSGWLRGLVMLNPGTAWAAAAAPMMRSVPTVVFDPCEQYADAFRFVLNNRDGMTGLMTHLWERGYRDFLWLDGDLDSAWDARERYEAFADFLHARNVPEGNRKRLQGGFNADVAYAAVRSFLVSGQVPRVIVSANDESAIGALRAVREFDLRVPEAVAVTGFDGLDVSAWTAPPLTTVHFDRRELGAKMAATLLTAIFEGTPKPGQETIDVSLLVRAST